MKRYLIITSIFIFLLATVSMADNYPKSNIGFNFGGWGMSDSSFGIRADGNNEGIADIELSGASARLTDSQIRTDYRDYDVHYYEKIYGRTRRHKSRKL